MISALILAAGQSSRMGQPKMPLPWGANTVLGQVIQTLQAARVEDVLVVTGGDRDAVEAIARVMGARTAFNSDYATAEMLSSLQVGLLAMGPGTEAVLVALGDQPQVLESIVRLVLEKYAGSPSPLIVPSFRMHRGHPWLVRRELWNEILEMRPPQTPRDFLNEHASEIIYLDVDTPTILQDIDTPDEYLKSRQ